MIKYSIFILAIIFSCSKQNSHFANSPNESKTVSNNNLNNNNNLTNYNNSSHPHNIIIYEYYPVYTDYNNDYYFSDHYLCFELCNNIITKTIQYYYKNPILIPKHEIQKQIKPSLDGFITKAPYTQNNAKQSFSHFPKNSTEEYYQNQNDHININNNINSESDITVEEEKKNISNKNVPNNNYQLTLKYPVFNNILYDLKKIYNYYDEYYIPFPSTLTKISCIKRNTVKKLKYLINENFGIENISERNAIFYLNDIFTNQIIDEEVKIIIGNRLEKCIIFNTYLNDSKNKVYGILSINKGNNQYKYHNRYKNKKYEFKFINDIELNGFKIKYSRNKRSYNLPKTIDFSSLSYDNNKLPNLDYDNFRQVLKNTFEKHFSSKERIGLNNDNIFYKSHFLPFSKNDKELFLIDKIESKNDFTFLNLNKKIYYAYLNIYTTKPKLIYCNFLSLYKREPCYILPLNFKYNKFEYIWLLVFDEKLKKPKFMLNPKVFLRCLIPYTRDKKEICQNLNYVFVKN